MLRYTWTYIVNLGAVRPLGRPRHLKSTVSLPQIASAVRSNTIIICSFNHCLRRSTQPNDILNQRLPMDLLHVKIYCPQRCIVYLYLVQAGGGGGAITGQSARTVPFLSVCDFRSVLITRYFTFETSE